MFIKTDIILQMTAQGCPISIETYCFVNVVIKAVSQFFKNDYFSIGVVVLVISCWRVITLAALIMSALHEFGSRCV
jgi:hypothetical protein